MHNGRSRRIHPQKHDPRSQSVQPIAWHNIFQSMFKPQDRNNTILMVSSAGMDRYPSWFVNDYQARVLVMVDNFDGSRGNRRFVTMNLM